MPQFPTNVTPESPNRPQGRQRLKPSIAILVYGIFLILHVVTTTRLALDVPFNSYLDERYHLSYALHLRDGHELFPDYRKMLTVDADNYRIWSDEKNFLPHPSPYYHLIDLIAGIWGKPQEMAFAPLRFANVGISTLTVLLMLLLGWLHLERPTDHLIYAAIVVMTPKIPVLGGIIQNDSLALLGGALTALGLMRNLKGSVSPATATMVGMGFAFAALAKLTAGLLVGFWILFSHWPLLRGMCAGDRVFRTYALCFIGVAAAGVTPYVANIINYGAPLYFDKSLFAYSGAHLKLNLAEYFPAFLYSLVVTWPGATPGRFLTYIGLFAVLGLSGFGVHRWTAWHGEGKRPPLLTFAVTSLFAILVTLPLHFAFSYDLHRETGNLASVHFRHYLPLWSGVAVGAVLGIRKAGRWRVAGAINILILLSLLTYGYVEVLRLPERYGIETKRTRTADTAFGQKSEFGGIAGPLPAHDGAETAAG